MASKALPNKKKHKKGSGRESPLREKTSRFSDLFPPDASLLARVLYALLIILVFQSISFPSFQTRYVLHENEMTVRKICVGKQRASLGLYKNLYVKYEMG